MTIRTLARRRRVGAVVLILAAAAPCSLAAIDTDPANDTMAGADVLTTTIGELVTHRAALIPAPGRLDVDFFMINASAGDNITITLTRVIEDGIANGADLNLRLHAYTPDANLISVPGIGQNPTMNFTTESDGAVYIGVGLAGDSDLDGVDDADPTARGDAVNQVETNNGLYDIGITVSRAIPSSAVLFEDLADCQAEVNALCPPAQTLFPDDGTCFIGTLVKRDFPDCEPDTFLVLFDKELNIIAQDDNGSTKGNGWASGLPFIQDGTGFIDDGDGTWSLRIGVTGRPDGLDGDFNGLFQNAGHQQFGEFTITVSFFDGGSGVLLGSETYTDRFNTGAEAFYINYDVPDHNGHASITIDNTTGAIAALPDQDVFHLEGLIPFCDYFITQIGGLNNDCRPTDTVMVWVDKNCGVIWASNEYSAATGFEELNIIADYKGRANFAIAGEDQRGRLLSTGLDMTPPEIMARAAGECILPDPNIDEGCYTLCFRLAPPHPSATGPMESGDVAATADTLEGEIRNAMSRGDLNMDGRTDTADLGLLLGNFGWAN